MTTNSEEVLFVDDRDLLDRAWRAYYRTGGPYAPQPANDSFVAEHKDRTYVMLKNCNGPLAVYRVTNGIVRGLKHWPDALNGW